MVCICIAWAVLIRGILHTFRNTPHLAGAPTQNQRPRVSVILPARNEELFIGRCLDSLVAQDYPDYEVIAIDDSSEDSTASIIDEYTKQNDHIVLVKAREKPEGWIGKNWACMEGYDKADGSLLLFTDSDTYFAPNTISTAVDHMLHEDLDALTAMPHIRAEDTMTKITLPLISVFLHTRFSAVKVNDPRYKTGYFFGSFFVIRRAAYEEAGMHRGVRHEIIEDGALGRKIKDMGYRLKMVLATNMIDAIWARDSTTLWNALKRLMVPLYLQNSKSAMAVWCALAFILFLPYPMVALGAALSPEPAGLALLATTSAASLMILFGSIIESGLLRIGRLYSAASPLGCGVIVGGFLAGILQARSKNSVLWRGRSYTLRDHSQSIEV